MFSFVMTFENKKDIFVQWKYWFEIFSSFFYRTFSFHFHSYWIHIHIQMNIPFHSIVLLLLYMFIDLYWLIHWKFIFFKRMFLFDSVDICIVFSLFLKFFVYTVYSIVDKIYFTERKSIQMICVMFKNEN